MTKCLSEQLEKGHYHKVLYEMKDKFPNSHYCNCSNSAC